MKLPSWISDIQALGWDLDGTLYPPNPALTALLHAREQEAVAKRMGWSRERTEREYARRYRELGSNTKTMISFGIDGVDFFTRFWDGVDLPVYLMKDERLPTLFEDLGGWRHFLISNSNRADQIERKLSLLGLDPGVFELVLSTVDIGAVKPDPKPFLVALEKLGLPPQQCLFVGDRESTDILGARGVGMRTCMVWGKSRHAEISLPTVYDVGRLFEYAK